MNKNPSPEESYEIISALMARNEVLQREVQRLTKVSGRLMEVNEELVRCLKQRSHQEYVAKPRKLNPAILVEP
jgi:hypothetical protein